MATKAVKAKKPAKAAVERNGPADEVLTLAEAAAWLKVPEADVAGLAFSGQIPGRKVGMEWRFLRSALAEWLKQPARISAKERMRALAGVWKDDPTVEDMLKEIYRQRGRPMTEDGE